MPTTARTRRAATATAAALLVGGAAFGAAAGTARAKAVCPTGFVCFQESATGGRTVRIAEGQGAYFPGGIQVYVATNSTRLSYCLTSRPYDYVLPPGQQAARSHTVLAARPGAVC
ncbi:hypothetical protein [Actinomadura sp. WMMA1423]|uniref:hypothetical protein n=1 Tax=Actinomadura sp. WMMA1423 TaxID=2591108 RepID=UPI0011464D70|nr:hypothetical protein [Actinomadura sp. WMMA1423]